MFQKSALNWFYLDFQKREILFSGSRDVPYMAVPANKKMNAVLSQIGKDAVTFREYKQYLLDHNLDDELLQFDGRSRQSVKYESLPVDHKTCRSLMQIFSCTPSDFSLDAICDLIYTMRQREKRETNKRLVDIAKNQLKNVVDILEKC